MANGGFSQAPMANGGFSNGPPGFSNGPGRVLTQATHTVSGPTPGPMIAENGLRPGEWGGAVRSGEAMRTAEQVRTDLPLAFHCQRGRLQSTHFGVRCSPLLHIHTGDPLEPGTLWNLGPLVEASFKGSRFTQGLRGNMLGSLELTLKACAVLFLRFWSWIRAWRGQ